MQGTLLLFRSFKNVALLKIQYFFLSGFLPCILQSCDEDPLGKLHRWESQKLVTRAVKSCIQKCCLFLRWSFMNVESGGGWVTERGKKAEN